MVCSEFFNMLDNYENLTENEKSDLNSHSAECEKCRNEFKFFKSITNTVSALPCPEPPQDLIARVNKQLDEMPFETGRFNIFINSIKRNSYRYATVAACLAVGLVVGLNSKTINEGLTNKDNDGVISTTTITETATEKPVDTTEAVETVAPVEEKKDTPAVKETKKKVKPEKADKKIKKTIKSNVNTAKQESKDMPVAATIPTVASEEASEMPVVEAPAATEPVETVAPQKERKSTYTIAKGVYYIPEATQKPAATETPADEMENYSLATGEYQIAIGYYDVPEDSAKNKKTDTYTEQLIVNVKDVGTITSYMSSLGAMNSGKGYQMSLDNFYELLSILDTEEISYRYSSGVNTGDTIIFSIVTY